MGMVTASPIKFKKIWKRVNFQSRYNTTTQHDRYIGKVIDSDGNVLVTVDTLESRIFFFCNGKRNKERNKIIGEIK
jgi:hypothetical protein